MSDLRSALTASYIRNGQLTPQIVVDEARPETAPLHDRFEWDDATAGEAYRRTQAADLIRSVRIVFTDKEPSGERKYVRALADFGREPQRSGDIANKLGKAVEQVAPLRAQLINKGMIYSPAHGDIAFTVPLFEEFLLREIPVFSAKDNY